MTLGGPETPNAPGAREIVGAVSWSAGGDLISKLAVIVVSIVGARVLAPERFAAFIGLLAAAYFAAAAWDAGVSTLVSVERSRAAAPLAGIALRVFRTRLVSLPAWLAAFALAVLAIRSATHVTVGDLIPFALLSIVVSVQLPILAALRADLNFRQAAFASFAGRWLTVATLGGALALRHGNVDLGLFGITHLVGEGLVVAIAVAVLRKPDAAAGVLWDERRISLRRALPYAANSLISIAYNRLDVLVVAVLVPATQLAAYVPASRLQDALYFGPTAIAAVALPYLVRHSPQGGWRMMTRLWLVGSLVAIPGSIALTVFMRDLLVFLLGPAYLPAVLPSQILAWSMPLAVIGAPLLAYLISQGRGAQTTIAFAVAGVLSLTLHVILDPRFGAAGAASASLARDAANVAVSALLVWRAREQDNVGDTFDAALPQGHQERVHREHL
jgi:O-antigen/teichoic acid export membrane protein